jgi:hypothetical protein
MRYQQSGILDNERQSGCFGQLFPGKTIMSFTGIASVEIPLVWSLPKNIGRDG